MPGLLVTSQVLLDKASDCESSAGDLDGKLIGLRQFTDQMVGIWGGVAMQSFVNLMGEFQRQGYRIHQALLDIAAGLRRDANAYIDTEGGATTNINSVAALIPGLNV